MAGAKNHQYHILKPSIWPLIGSLSALAMFFGLVMWFHPDQFGPNGKWVFGAGIIGVFFTMFSWWVDVVREANQGDHTPIVQLHLRYGMILFIASEVMFFVAWFWAYFDASLFPAALEQGAAGEWALKTEFSHGDAATKGVWPPEGMHVLNPFGFPLLNTMILLCSGTTVTWAHHALLHGDRKGLQAGLWVTILLGILFTSIQGYEYWNRPFLFAGTVEQGANIYGSTFVMATGFHGFHVVVGTIFLIVCLIRSYNGAYTPKQHFGFEAAAWYWHFVDVVWLFLFLCIYVWGGWGAEYH